MRTFGKYRLVEFIASGGMADVWRAEVSGAEGVVKEVALKLVRGEHASRGEFVRMFVQEARLAARLGHANLVQVFEFDQIDGRYYIAMELVRGRHLGRVVDRARDLGVRFGLARAVQAVAEVARALAYAHRLTDAGRPLGLVHRDVSPHNVLVSFEGEVKLTDFGIAQALDCAGLTDPGTLKGKVAYMAPEQARGEAVDGRADVFAAGVILWELCTGRRLFARDTDAATLAAVLSSAPVAPPSAWNEDVPPELDRAVLGALERDPARRIATAQELATALAAIVLHLARSPDDLDLRALMHRLFPDEAAAVHGPAPEPTRVRRVAEPADEDVRAAGQGGAAGSAPGHAAPRRGATASGGSDAPTRTATVEARRRAGRGRRAVAATLAAGALGAAALVAAKGGIVPARLAEGAAVEAGTESAPGPGPGAPAQLPEPTPAPSVRPERSSAAGEAEPKGRAGDTDTTPHPGPLPAARGEGERSTATSTVRPERSSVAGEAESTSSVRPERSAAAGGAESKGAHSPPSLQPPGPREIVHQLHVLPVPAASTGEGVLTIYSTRWARVRVDGHSVDETPVELRLAAGRHRVRSERAGQRAVERTVTVRAGTRTTLRLP